MTREHFISDLSHWNSYLPLLWKALQETEGDVIELGIGDGSTHKLHDYCKENGRNLFSYESNKEWFFKFDSLQSPLHRLEYVGHNWEILYEQQINRPISVIFSDEAPGHMRKYNVSMFAQTAQVIVVHDAEESNDHGYRLSWVKPLFKYYKMDQRPGASTAAFSNFIDVTKWDI